MSALGQNRSFRPGQPNVRFAPKAAIRSAQLRPWQVVGAAHAGDDAVEGLGGIGTTVAQQSAAGQCRNRDGSSISMEAKPRKLPSAVRRLMTPTPQARCRARSPSG